MGLVRVFEIPDPDGGYCFGGGKPTHWVERDWFRDDNHPEMPGALMSYEEGRQEIDAMVRGKNYYREDVPLLVMSPDYSFTINYDPDAAIRRREERRRQFAVERQKLATEFRRLK